MGFWPIFLMVRNVFEFLDQRTRSSRSIFCGKKQWFFLEVDRHVFVVGEIVSIKLLFL